MDSKSVYVLKQWIASQSMYLKQWIASNLMYLNNG